MNNLKKLMGLLLVAAMMLTIVLGTAVYADEDNTFTIKVKTTDQSTHEYQAFQIFKGTKAEGKKLEALSWGEGIVEADLLSALKEDKTIGSKFESVSGPAETAAAMGKLTDEAEIKALANVIGKYVNDKKINPTVTLEKTEGGYKKDAVSGGYYLIQDKPGTKTTNGEALTRYILQVNGNVEVAAKSKTTESEKKVADDIEVGESFDLTTVTAEQWKDSADYDIGDKVPFMLKATIAADYAEYKTYKLTFHDKESEGLTFDKASVKVYAGDTEIDSSKYVVKTEDIGEDTFQVHFENLKTVDSVTAGTVISVKYLSTLNDSAKIGSEGNPNEMHITYSNNPTDEQGGENGKTPKDKVIVFTYQLTVDKVDENKKPLAKAGFTLFKKSGAEDEGYSVTVEKIDAGEGTTFEFKGLDAGEYKLVETDVPTGYNKAADLVFKITATHELESADPRLTALASDKDAVKLTEESEGRFSGEFKTTVENRSGSTLPETGGMGTTLIYILGAILVIGGSLVLITRKRLAR